MPRTDSDSWDLASSVGATATAVAAGRALASQGPNPLLDDPLAEPLVRAVGHELFIKMVDGQAFAEDDPVLNPRSMNEQMAVRTRFFDDFFTAAGQEGIRQVVILAAGLDTRAYRLAWPAGTVVYEVDQPEVIEFKTRTLTELGATPNAERRTVGIDLRDDWPAALRQAGFDTGARTAWIAEGLLVYLPPEAQDRLFDHLTTLSAPGSRVATEHMDLQSLPADWAQKLDERAQRMGSDLNLADLFYTGDRHAADTYLAAQGWQVSTIPTREAFAANGFVLPDDELAAFVGGDSGYLWAVLQ